MRKLTKRFLALAVTLLLVLTTVSIPAMAEGETITITTTEVEQPAYNAWASYDLTATVKDSGGTAIEDALLKWELDGSYSDVTLTEEGTLTIKRTLDNVNTQTVAVKATYNGAVVGTANIAVIPTQAYLRSDRIVNSATAYDRDTFVADMEDAEHIAVLNFEDGDGSTGKNFAPYDNYSGHGVGPWYYAGADVPVSNAADTNLRYTWFEAITKSGTTKYNIGWHDHAQTTTYGKSSISGPMYAASNANAKATSGSYITSIGKNQEETRKYTLFFDDVVSTDALKPTALGYALSNASEYSTEHTATVTYSDGTNETIENISGIVRDADGKSVFFGVKAERGKFIKKIEMNGGTWCGLDDICVIMSDPNELPDESKTSSIEISGEASIKQPIYNCVEKRVYTAVAKDDEENVLAPKIQWKLEGDYYGEDASIDENGVLTVKRGFNPENKIKVVAYVYDEVNGKNIESAPFEVTVSETEAYFPSATFKNNATSYTRDSFLKDMERANHIAVLNFEDGDDAETGKNFSHAEWYANTATHVVSYKAGAGVPITNDGTIGIYWQYYNSSQETPKNYKLGFADTKLSGNPYGKNSVTTELYKNNQYAPGPNEQIPSGKYASILDGQGAVYNVFFESATDYTGNSAARNANLKPVAFACALANACQYSTDVTVKLFLDDDSVVQETAAVKDYEEGKYTFFALRAPLGRYVKKVQLISTSACLIDDVAVIMEDITLDKAPRFSKDEKSYEPIFTIKDAEGTDGIYVELVEKSATTEKLILAAYGEGGELIGVNTADLKDGKAGFSVPLGKTVKKIKMFTWDSLSTITPVKADTIIE